jgi:hypothetical protein
MTTYHVGETVAWGITVTSAAGAAANPGTGPTATVTLPDATTASAVVTSPQTGSFVASYLTTQPGRHRVSWAASGANSADFPYIDSAAVWPVDPRLIISLADARAALNLPTGTRVNDDELLLYVAATTPVIEDITGPILGATRVETYDGSRAAGAALLLHAYPTAITTVVEDGTTLAATAYKVGQGGVLWRVGRDWSTLSPGNVVVTYTVGSGVVPPNVILAAREEVRHLYQVGQVAARPALGTAQAPGMAYTPTGFAVPHRVVELLADQVGARQGLGVH